MATTLPSELDDSIVLGANGVYTVSSYELTVTLLRDPRLRPATIGILDELSPEWRRSPALRMLAEMVLLDMPPRHGAVRAVMHEQFSPSAVTGLHRRIDELTEKVIAATTVDEGPIDFASGVARALPLAVIGELIGVDEDDRHRVARRTRTVMDAMWHSVTDIRRADASAAYLERYFHEWLRRYRADGSGPDLTRSLTDAVGLEDHEIVANLVFLFMAATFTTGDFIGSAMVRSFREPGLRQLLCDGTAVGEAIEEALRLDPPVSRVLRNAGADIDLRGAKIPAGSVIEFDLRAANRDPRQFDDPDSFRADRRAGRALSFGYGAHYCAGWALGRAEAMSVLPAFWRRYPDARLAGDPERESHPFLNGFKRIPVDTGRAERGR